VVVYRAEDIKAHSSIKLGPADLLLVALLAGRDYLVCVYVVHIYPPSPHSSRMDCMAVDSPQPSNSLMQDMDRSSWMGSIVVVHYLMDFLCS
jgi:hypothetical protein